MCRVGAKIFQAIYTARGGAMAMQCKEKPRLLHKKQMQALAAELEKTELDNLVEEVCKQAGK